LDVELTCDIVIPLHVDQADIHIFYLIGNDQAIQIKDLQQGSIYIISSSRGRYVYLPTGVYELYIPIGKYTLINFYFRGSIFRDGNERPFRFLHPLIDAYRGQDSRSCCSLDFRAGPVTMARIRHLASNLRKGDLDNDHFIYGEFSQLIKLSNSKVHEEYEQLSQSMIYAQKAHDMIEVFVAEYGQDFLLSDLAAALRKSQGYLSEVHTKHFGYNLAECKMKQVEALAKSKLLAGYSTKETAFECGFNSESAFCKFFRRRTDLSPTDYKNKSETPS
jgi:AraC-like DNA-binding protein